jgi:hypothetical protein
MKHKDMKNHPNHHPTNVGEHPPNGTSNATPLARKAANP